MRRAHCGAELFDARFIGVELRSSGNEDLKGDKLAHTVGRGRSLFHGHNPADGNTLERAYLPGRPADDNLVNLAARA